MIIIILAIVGLAGILLGIISLFWANSLAKSEGAPKNWRRMRIIALVIGVLIGAASWPGTYFMGYAYKGEKATDNGRVVGLPIMVAYFDSKVKAEITSALSLCLRRSAIPSSGFSCRTSYW